MTLEFRRLPDVPLADIVRLFNDPDVRRHLPLATGAFTEESGARFVEAKERMWTEHGFGPWALFADGQFAGWGGLQPEAGDADLGFVLHRAYWGMGLRLAHEVLRHAFTEMQFSSVIVLLPPSRTRLGALRRLGFERDGEFVLSGHTFHRYRLSAEAWRRRLAGAEARGDDGA